MNTPATSSRRASALTRDRIIEAAVGLLDESGEAGLTFRALAQRLETGAGAIYWHIDDKRDLVLAACDLFVGPAVRAPADDAPDVRIRAIAIGLFDAMEAHPWMGAALAVAAGELPLVRILEALGQQVRALAVDEADQWSTTQALMSYILGVGGQHAARSQLARQQNLQRTRALNEVAQAWAELDADVYPFTRSMALQLPNHDDRADFMAGVDLILNGIAQRIG
ncbi:TPA: TetR family transcriptional regulator [Stenotrophomonas maltophilia]|nr:TetR family transcriptional regulator [Stenotrophomonas maltophilia]HDS1027118.1 TetR family transcriptional regulator [Stenotrophomonas maltophilia]HDS1031329.1 TetR family transcriptional regulator [Stenotrophomonas maltophilia]HDS1035993.1 TetR family transcriptional regulator [Stenotrophomonas maltophilia]